MRWFIYGEDQIVSEWVQKRIEHASFDRFVTIGLAEDSRIIAGVVYHNYITEYGNIEMSVAADKPNWATRATLQTFFSYPFIQLNCKRVTACCPARNTRALRFNYGIGFRKEGCIRQGFGNDDMIVMGMLRNEAQKWVKQPIRG